MRSGGAGEKGREGGQKAKGSTRNAERKRGESGKAERNRQNGVQRIGLNEGNKLAMKNQLILDHSRA